MADVRISLVIPTISRPTLARTLHSLRNQAWGPSDEVLLVGDGPNPIARELWAQFVGLPGRYLETSSRLGAWGHGVRNWAMETRQAAGTHLMALDDDDEYAPDAIAVVRAAIAEAPDRPHVFRMSGAPVVGDVWKERVLSEGNIGTPMMVVPNDPTRLGRYGPRYGGDFDFCRSTCDHYPDGPVWHEDVICRVRPWPVR